MVAETDVPLEEDIANAGVGNPAANDVTNSTVIETTEDESEEEDVDFNPFLKGSLSEEASSSLSSEVEGLDTEVVNSHSNDAVLASEDVSHHVESMVDKFMGDERVGVSCEDEQENGTVQGLENGSTSGTGAVENAYERSMEMRDTMIEPTFEFDDEDAICKRTRARYSLASFTLDELETFLQETDDDDDFQNVDEEEEYRKFLAAVLNGGDGDDQGIVEGNDEDDDEDNDADFEIEIQEALESDVDDCRNASHNNEELDTSSRRPKTRKNKRRKTPASTKKNGTKRENRPLRPLVPIMYSAPDASVPSHTQNLPSNGFVDHQIGQLYGLMYEHVQLLIQVYSLCVLEPSRHHIAAQVKGLLCELLHKRDLVLAWRNDAYPTSCFVPQYVSPISVEIQKCIPASITGPHGSDGQEYRWLPRIVGPVLSVLDVEPLKLVGKYIDGVSNAVREHQKRCVEATNIYLEKEPLFPHPICPSLEVNGNVNRGDDYMPCVSAVSSNDKVPKKTMAGALVESTKKQSVALVPQSIAKLAQPFYTLFNPALFPHKPPLPAVANRVHFTDAEDVLLAMGVMEYNTDWKAIQQRFLPCKSARKIFIRMKNRSSSNAPDNPIKAVRKLKTSPLTEDEKARIEQALKTFKLDWASIWRAVVPYRDPNQLQRQWRIAIGTQKSYKMPASAKEKHRVYELNRRRRKVDQTDLYGGLNRNGEDGVANGNEAYVHEAFLADWRPINAGSNTPQKIVASNHDSRCLPGDLPSSRLGALHEKPNDHVNKEPQFNRYRALDVSVGSEVLHHTNHKSFQAYTGSWSSTKIKTSKAFGCESVLGSQKAQKPGFSNLVRLAPELPPVKLPPAVRVISQASLRSSQIVSSIEVGATGHGHGNPVSNPTVIDQAANLVKSVRDKTRVLNSNSASVSSHQGETLNNRSVTEDGGNDVDPQMHPLLFRSLEEGHVASYPVKNSSIIPTFSFFPALQHQMTENLLRSPHIPSLGTGSQCSSSKEIASTSSSLDFHPFLQKTSDFNAKSFGADSTSLLLMTDLELSRDRCVEELGCRTGTDAAQLATTSNPTSPNTNVNDLDLGIQLSYSSRKRKTSSGEGNRINPLAPPASEGRFAEISKSRMNSHDQFSENASHHVSDPLLAKDMGKSCSDDSAAPIENWGGGASSSNNDTVNDQPLLEIVMEQEELSDSDEEMEDVEFECEEITDSDGEEGTGAEQIENMKHKDQRKTTLVRDNNAQCTNPSTCDISEGRRAQRKGRTLRADLTRLEKGSTEGSWLSLNPHSSHHIEQPLVKTPESSAGAIPVLSRATKYPKKATSRKKSLVDPKESVGSDPLPSSSRKHKKQVIKARSTSGACIAVVHASCSEKDGKI